MPADCELCCSAPAAVNCADCSMLLCHENGCDENMHGDASTKDHVRTDVMAAASAGGGEDDSDLCSLCAAPSSVYCEECACFYCEENGCDADMHKPASFAKHRRRPAEQKHTEEASKLESPSPSAKTPGPVVLCELCSVTQAGLYCQDCDMKLCDNCNNEMHRRSILKKHVRLKMVNGVVQEPSDGDKTASSKKAVDGGGGKRDIFSNKRAKEGAATKPAAKKPGLTRGKSLLGKFKSAAKMTMQLSAAVAVRGAWPQCGNCEESKATIRCDDCGMDLCEENNCDRDMHKPSKMRDHVRHPLVRGTNTTRLKNREAPKPAAAPITVDEERMCDNCDAQVAEVYCDQCDLNLCDLDNCDADMHKASKSMDHDRHPLKVVRKNVPSVESKVKSRAAAVATPTKSPPGGEPVETGDEQCELCQKNRAEVRCEQCLMYLCNKNKCNAELHATAGFKTHVRRTLKWVEEKAKEDANSHDLFRPAKELQEPASDATNAANAKQPTAMQDSKQAEPAVDADGLPPDLYTPCVCSLCEDAPAVVYCVECKRHLCTKNNCDSEMHVMQNFKSHRRVSKHKEEEVVATASPRFREQQSYKLNDQPVGNDATTRHQLTHSFTGSPPDKRRAVQINMGSIEEGKEGSETTPQPSPLQAHYNPYQIAMGVEPATNARQLTGWEKDVALRVGEAFVVSRPTPTEPGNVNMVPQDSFNPHLVRCDMQRMNGADVWTVTALAAGDSTFVVRHVNTRNNLQTDLVNLMVHVHPVTASAEAMASSSPILQNSPHPQSVEGAFTQHVNAYKMAPPSLNHTLPPSSPDVSFGVSHIQSPEAHSRALQPNSIRQGEVDAIAGQAVPVMEEVGQVLQSHSMPPTPPHSTPQYQQQLQQQYVTTPSSVPMRQLQPSAAQQRTPNRASGIFSTPAMQYPSSVQIGPYVAPSPPPRPDIAPSMSPSAAASNAREQNVFARSISMQGITESIVNAPELAPMEKVAMVDNLVQRVLTTPAPQPKRERKSVMFDTPSNQYFESKPREPVEEKHEYKFAATKESPTKLLQRPAASVWGMSDSSDEEEDAGIYVGGGEEGGATPSKAEVKEKRRMHARHRNKVYWKRQARARKAKEIAAGRLNEEQDDRTSAKLSKFIPMVEEDARVTAGRMSDKTGLSEQDERMVAWLDAEDNLVKAHEENYRKLRERRARSAKSAVSPGKRGGSKPVGLLGRAHGPPREFDEGFLHLTTYDHLFKLANEFNDDCKQSDGIGEDSDVVRKRKEEQELDKATDLVMAQIRREAWTEASVLQSPARSPYKKPKASQQRQYPPLMSPPRLHVNSGVLIDKALDTSITASLKRRQQSKDRQIADMEVGLHSGSHHDPISPSWKKQVPSEVDLSVPLYRSSLRGLLPTPTLPRGLAGATALSAEQPAISSNRVRPQSSPLKRSIMAHEDRIRRTYAMPMRLKSPSSQGGSPSRAVSRRARNLAHFN